MKTHELLETFANLAKILGAIGIYIAFLTYRARQLENRFNQLSKLFHDYLNDEMMLRIYNDIEWLEEEEFNRRMRDQNEYRLEMERFFAIFENYLHVKERQLKGNPEGFEIYEYMLGRIVGKSAIHHYLNYTLSDKLTAHAYPYPRLKRLANRLNN